MQTIFQPNVVKCPHCHKDFENNYINGIALIDAVNRIEARKRMYLKLSLDTFETMGRNGDLEFGKIRKILFDNFNDMIRDVQTILGLNVRDIE